MIQINLLRISPDSKYIELSVECPTNYRFNTLNIKKYDYSTTTNYPTNSNGWVALGSAYVGTTTKEVIRIATSIFVNSSMFYVEFGVRWIGTTTEPLNADGSKLSDKTTIGVCSDVNNMFGFLVTNILGQEYNCCPINDDLKRAFTFLYAHQEAMRLENFTTAEKFYDILKNNFSNCTTVTKYVGINTCNCNS